MTEKRREFNMETHVVFIDYEKVLDKINPFYVGFSQFKSY